MPDDEALGAGHLGGHLRHRVPRRRGADDHRGGGERVDVGERPFEVEVLRGRLLDEVGAGQRLGEVGVHRPRIPVGTVDHVEFGQGRPCGVDEAGEPVPGVRVGVPHLDGEPAGEKVGGPAAADRARPDARDRADGAGVGEGGVGHRSAPFAVGVCTRRSRISRASAGVATSAPRSSMIETARSVSASFVALTPLEM